jgi:alkylation response protein AidB-like acyl-CoA dehydrogenase
VIERFGELALLVRSARALVRAAGDALDEAKKNLTEETSTEASVAVAAARAQADTAAMTVSSDIFALIGSRSTGEELNLSRHWRNARTHTLHDPRRWKIRHIGNWELNDTPPPRNGII